MRLKAFLLVSFMLALTKLVSQDIQFSQFYASALYLNPAFAGSAHVPRLSFHERIQWPGIEAKYLTSLFSFDTYFSKQRSGFGLMMLHDVQGSRTLKTSEVSLQYSYELPVANSFTIRAGLQGGIVSRNINYSGMVFPDQLNTFGVASPTEDPLSSGQKVNYLDFASGLVLYSDKIWFGFSSHHMSSPNQSFADGVSRLPIKYAFVAGYKYTRSKGVYNDDLVITPTIHYKFQGKSDQFDAGIYAICRNVISGIWYRGIPLLKRYKTGVQNNESVVFLAGYKFNTVSVSYSYDITVSLLKLVRSAGSHELNVTWTYRENKKKPTRRLPCPRFYHH